MRFERLIVQVNSPFKEMDDPGTSRDHQLAISRKGQYGDQRHGPEGGRATVKHTNRLHDNYVPTLGSSQAVLQDSRSLELPRGFVGDGEVGLPTLCQSALYSSADR